LQIVPVPIKTKYGTLFAMATSTYLMFINYVIMKLADTWNEILYKTYIPDFSNSEKW